MSLDRYKWYQNQTPGDVPPRRPFPEGRGVDTRRCASKDVGHRRGVDLVVSQIDWIKERVSARTLGPEGGWIVISHIGWGGEQNIFYGVKTFP